eukprot:13382179-Ditylum_brightwellii.AAC.1
MPPAAKGHITSTFAAQSHTYQKKNIANLHAFLKDTTKLLLMLNANSNKYTMLVNLPHSNTVKMVHGLGMGASGIGAASPVDGKFFFITGEGDKEIGCLECLCVPASMRDLIEIKCPLDAQLQEHLHNSNTTLAGHRFVPTSIPEDKMEVMQLVPIPAFLVYDRFVTDLQAEEVYEHLLSLADQTPTWITHAKAFLHTYVVKQNTRDPKVHINQATYLRMAPPEAEKWASHQFG